MACEKLGEFYRYGKVVARDLVKARQYYKKAGYINIAASIAAEIEAEEAAAALERRKAARKEVFISYARRDGEYRDELGLHLKAMSRTREITWWDDTQIKTGAKWDTEIKAALARAKIAIMMVSVNLIASDYVWEKELPALLEAAENEGATILWVPVSTCDLEDTIIAKYQAIIDPKTPLDKLPPAERNEVYTKLVKEIKKHF